MAQPCIDSDAQLVESVRRGEHAAFDVLIARHQPLTKRLCQRLLRDRSLADDAVQEAVLQAWLSLHRLRRADRFGAWLVGIALHICHGWLRYRADQTWSLEALLGGRVIPEPIDTEASPVDAFEVRELGRQIRRAITELPVGQRSAVALFYLADLSHADIAALLGIEPGAVKTRLHKARGRLRRSLLDIWREEHMTTETSTAPELIDVEIEDVRAITVADPPGDRKNVWLVDRATDRVLPIWVGAWEGDAIAVGLLRAETPRPLTHAFAAQLLQASGARLAEVRIERLVDETFYAQVHLDTSAGRKVVDARPSDAIALALESEVPIRVNSQVMHQASVNRAELAEKSPESRSARKEADEIRARLTQPRANWTASSLF